MKIIKKILAGLALTSALACGVLITLWLLNAPEKLATGTQSLALLEQVNYEVDSLPLTIVDQSRPTPALGEYQGDDARTLNGTVWFPKGATGAHPLLVYSHGFGGYHEDSTHLTNYLVSNGYVVAAVDFPLSNRRSPAGVPQLLDISNQPGDVSAIINHILTLNNDQASALHQHIDTTRIGAFGLSLGGLTTALVTFHPDYQDARIKTSVMMAPPIATFSNNFYATNTNVSSLVISGSLDRVVPAQENAKEVQPRHPSGWFMGFDKATHLGFANVGKPLRWMNNPDDLGCVIMGRVMSKLELPERWAQVLPNTQNVIRDVVVSPPCPEIPGEAMNGHKQQWLTKIAIASFFDMNLRSDGQAQKAGEFFKQTLASENPEITLTAPRQ